MAKNARTYNSRRAKRRQKKNYSLAYLAVVAGVALLSAFIAYGSEEGDALQTPSADTACLQEVAVPDELPEIIKEYTGFKVSFNPLHHLPNYVVWELTGDEANGTEPRDSKFKADKDVYGSPTLEDYRNSGFDRGHMAPAGDMKWSAQAMSDSHYLTNMCPQTRQLNGGRWSTLEQKCRQWAVRDSALIIITGPILSDELTRTIGPNGVSVPERFFKVIYAPFANPPRAIAFIMPNAEHIDGLESLTVSVDQVEAVTGFDFFACLPDDIEDTVEQQANFRDWNRRKR